MSRTEYGKQSEPFLDVARNESDARLSASPSQSILPQTFSSKNPADNNQMENPRCPGNITEAVFDKELELSERNANVGYISLSSPSCKMVTCSRGAPCPNGNTMKESLVSPREG